MYDARMDRDAILAILREADEVEFAYLFGSRSRGGARADSDWDLAVYLDERLDANGRAAVHKRLAAAFPQNVDVDLVVLNDSPSLLAHRALSGDQLFVRDRDLFARVFVRILGQSMDEAYWREMYRTARLARIEEGTFGRS